MRVLAKQFLAVCLGLVLTGCGGSEGLQSVSLVPVSGTLTKGGQPLGGVNLSLVPVESGKEALVAEVADDGSFTLHYSDGREGGVPGKYSVVLEARLTEAQETAKYEGGSGDPDKEPAPPAELPFPKEFLSPESTPKTVEVPAGGGTLNIDL